MVKGVPLPQWKQAPRSTNFSPDGKQLVTVDRSMIQFYDAERHAESGKIQLTLDADAHGRVGQATWSPNRRLLAAIVTRSFDEVMPHRLGLWDTRLRKLLGVVTIPSPLAPTALRFSPSNDKIMTIHPDKLLLLWDAKKIVSLGDKTL